MKVSSCFAATLAAAALLASAAASRAADLIYYVELNVASLIPKTDGPFSLDLQLSRGSGNVTNSVTLSNFVSYGGNFDLSPNYTSGGATGSMSGSITLTNSGTNNELAQAFDRNVRFISFKVDQTTNSETVTSGTPIPEQFSVYIDDKDGNFIPTTDGANFTLVTTSLAAGQTLSSVHTYTSTSPDEGVTVNLTTVPEPGSFGLLALGGLALAARRRRPAPAARA